MTLVLVGAGGHAKAIVEMMKANGTPFTAYADPRPAAWLDLPRIEDEAIGAGTAFVVGLGGVTPQSLHRRLEILDGLCARGLLVRSAVHPRAIVGDSARIDAGAVVLAGAVVQPGATIARGAIVNTGAIVEHDSEIAEGAHIAPGAIVLGGCRIGACALIGAGAVVLPGARVENGALVPAATRVAA